MSQKVDPDKLKYYIKNVFDALGGAMTSTMIYLGDRLGFYAAMADGQPVSSEELAARTGFHERWIREWMFQQGAAGILDHVGDNRFALSPEGEATLANELHPACGVGFFSHLPAMLQVAERLPEAFKSGRGLPYDAFGPEGAAGVERGLAPWFRTLLVPMALPKIPGVVAALEAGTQVADVGCGGGVALIEMAKAYPKSQFHGYDISRHALERAEANRAEAGLDNVAFHDAADDPLPADARFGLVTTFDCLHDMAHPDAAIVQIRKAIRPDGTWFIADIKARETYAENAEKNPLAAMMYGSSVLTCMSSALSEPDGMGLGTLGLHPRRLQEMTESAGFSQFEPLDLGHPANAFYVVRP